ncbi:MAG: N-6 DNA methylase, partial [Armatimonadota bacterium]
MADAQRGSMDLPAPEPPSTNTLSSASSSSSASRMRSRKSAPLTEKDQGADPEDPDEYRAHKIFWVPPVGNANFAWVQHIVHHLAPAGVAGFVIASGSMSRNQSGEGEIGKGIIEADLMDCMVALLGQVFYSTQIPACLWFIALD